MNTSLGGDGALRLQAAVLWAVFVAGPVCGLTAGALTVVLAVWGSWLPALVVLVCGAGTGAVLHFLALAGLFTEDRNAQAWAELPPGATGRWTVWRTWWQLVGIACGAAAPVSAAGGLAVGFTASGRGWAAALWAVGGSSAALVLVLVAMGAFGYVDERRRAEAAG